MKTPLPYPGGKQRRAAEIVRLINAVKHNCYCEPFAGGLSVLFAKNISPCEIVNDKNGVIVNFWKVVRDWPEELLTEMEALAISSEQLHGEARKLVFGCQEADDLCKRDKIRTAWAIWYLHRLSIFGLSENNWRASNDRNTSLNRMHGQIREMKNGLFARMKHVQIANNDFEKVFNIANGDKTIVFFDPPYTAGNAGSYDAFTSEDMLRVVECCRRCEGNFILTCDYNEHLVDAPEVKDGRWSLRPTNNMSSIGNYHSRHIIDEVIVHNIKESQMEIMI